MVGSVLSECGIKPLPLNFQMPLNGVFGNSRSKPIMFHSENSYSSLKLPLLRVNPLNIAGERNWALNVSASLSVASMEDEEERGERMSNLKDVFHGEDREKTKFDSVVPPPFKLGDIQAAIPKYCWVKDPWMSMKYGVSGLAAPATYLHNWAVRSLPLYWACRETIFRSLFVLGGHDWRIGHRSHHQNHGHAKNDEHWCLLTEKTYKSLDNFVKALQGTKSPGKMDFWFHPNSDLFVSNEREDALTFTICWITMIALLIGLCFVMGAMQMIKLSFLPHWVFISWLDFVAYKRGHVHEEPLPWYRGKGFSFSEEYQGGKTGLETQAVKVGPPSTLAKKKNIRRRVPVHHPKNLGPEFARRSRHDQYNIIKYPLVTEATMKEMMDHNTLVFIVDVRADKDQIRDAMKKIFGFQAKKVNTLINQDGAKKAFVKLGPEYNALDVAKKLRWI